MIELDPSATNPYAEEKRSKTVGERDQVSPSDIYLQTSQDMDIQNPFEYNALGTEPSPQKR